MYIYMAFKPIHLSMCSQTKCQECSSHCPTRFEIITEPCSQFQDIRCGPFIAAQWPSFTNGTISASTSNLPSEPSGGSNYLVYDWKPFIIFISIALVIFTVMLIVGSLCIRQKFQSLNKKTGYSPTPAPIDI